MLGEEPLLRLRSLLVMCAVVAPAAVSAVPTTHYRSIGSASDYTTGTVTAVNGETHVIGSLDVQWKTANRGRGDKLTIAGMDYTILSVDAENELTLTQPYAGPTTYAEPYTIARKFKRLVDWENCVEAIVACPGVSTASLPTDERVEIGVVYKDTPFMINQSGEQLRLDAVATSAAYPITLTTNPANRHHGIEGTGVVIDNGTNTNSAIEIKTGFVTIEWIELHNGDSTEQIFVSGVGPSSQVVVHNVLFKDDDNTSNGFHVNDDEANVLFFNNVLYGLDNGVHIDGLQVSSTGWFEFYHNTFFGNRKGLNSTKSTPGENDVIAMKGNLAHSNFIADYDAFQPAASPSSDNNMSGDGTAATHYGVSSVPLANVQFVSPVTPYDFHIKRGSFAEDGALPIAAVTDDLDGRSRGTPDIGADETDSSSANPVKILTAKASFEQVQLEWQHPDFGPMDRIEIVRSGTAFPLTPADGSTACTFATPAPFTKGQCADSLMGAGDNGVTYYYSAFVYDTGGNYSKEASVMGIPFDKTAVPPEWTYATRASTLDPAGVRGGSAFVVSNDFFFHSMQGDKGATGGEWPLTGWAPYKLPAMAQHRPTIVDVAGNNTALLGAQDGRVYAVDIASGKLVWKSPVLGSSIAAAPAALVGAYGASGGAADKVFVGTSDPGSNSLFVLDLMTGAIAERFDDVGQPANIGAITGVAVKYPSGPVYFSSDDGSGGATRNVWCIDVSLLPATPVELWSDNPGPVDAGPTLYKSKVFVGSRAGALIGYNDLAPVPVLVQNLGDGPVKAPIFPVWPNDTLIFSTNTSVNSVQFSATGGCGTPPCINWGQAVGAGATPALFVPGTTFVFAGNGSGVFYELGISLATPTLAPAVRGWTISSSALGGPAFSVPSLVIYVTDTGGRVHGIPWPIP
jgi:hypothetical protein